jgi:hypothetical protein
VTINLSNNSMRDSLTNALTVVKSAGAPGSFSGTINANSIGDFTAPLDPNAGSLEGAGIEVTHFGGGNLTLAVTNNRTVDPLQQFGAGGAWGWG